MAYLGLSPEPNYPDQYFTSPGEVIIDNKKAGFPVQPDYATELPMTPQQIEKQVKREQALNIAQMTPQQIEAQVKREQSPMALYVIGAIAAYLLLMR